MSNSEKKFNWLGLVVEIIKVVVSFVAGTQIELPL